MSLERLEHRLAELLSSDDLDVAVGPLDGTPAGTLAAGVLVETVLPRPTMGGRRSTELEPQLLRRIAAVTARVVVWVRPAGGPVGRDAALRAATELWWRCDAVDLTSGAAFADDLAEGYLVERVVPVSLRTPDHADAAGAHRIDVDVHAAVWPRELPAEAGTEISHPLVRLAGRAPAGKPGPFTVSASQTLTVAVEINLRSFALGDPDVPDAPGRPPRRVRAAVVPGGDEAVGALVETELDVVGDRVPLAYMAGARAGRDHVVLDVVDGDSELVRIGELDIEVRA